ncbi:2-phospho-L-lactate guanylyltransferase [Microbacterium halotolerans]|uniref:2-phospho-L-lactate guanylyltransferase n=1 Tax=Microbacterium halotolerans TaxID=246613 RepID=UPI000E6AAA77|nr:2-phospho-L-lactate guanylyltransferase [Microbacterium halotolerans]
MSSADAPDDRGRRTWALIVPVKPASVGKSRLAVPGVEREAIARAIALDTIAAAAGANLVAELIVVTDDAGVREELGRTHPSTVHGAAARVTVVADPANGLNAAIAAGLATASARRSAAMLGDLPALRPADLDGALAHAVDPVHLRRSPRFDRDPPRSAQTNGRALVVADADGTGTTLLAHAHPELLRFGADSYARHLAAGAAPLDVPTSSTLRQDVDTAAHLTAARGLGLGPRTAALLA